jgi:hypothetical protein
VVGAFGLYTLVARASSGYSHSYPAPGPGCGDEAEDDNGQRDDVWSNEDHAGVQCYPDHVDIDARAGGQPIGTDVFRLESDIDGPPASDLTRHGRNGFLVTVTVHVRSGGPDARAGITFAPSVPLQDSARVMSYPVYFFNVDLAGRWHVATHDIFGAFQSDLDSGSGPTAKPADVDHVLRVLYDAHVRTLTFTVDGAVTASVHPPAFEYYRIGVGLACSYDPKHTDTCLASARDYRYAVTRDN